MALTAIAATAVIWNAHAAGPLSSGPCPDPRFGLRHGQSNVEAHTTTFSYKSERFPIEVYSGYAIQNTHGGNIVCVRYEVENKSGLSIKKFFWPTAGIEMDSLGGDRESVVHSSPHSGNPPRKEESWLYAFLSSAVRINAYQRQASALSLSERERFAISGQFNLRQLAALHTAPIQLAQVSENPTRRQFKAPEVLAEIGAQYSAAGAEVSAISSAKWDGKNFTISVSIGRNNGTAVRNLRAPFAVALQKADSAERLLELVREIGNMPLPMFEDRFNVSTTLPPAVASTIYLIRQPIIFERSSGRACFLAVAYSPVPIPTQLLSCRLV